MLNKDKLLLACFASPCLCAKRTGVSNQPAVPAAWLTGPASHSPAVPGPKRASGGRVYEG